MPWAFVCQHTHLHKQPKESFVKLNYLKVGSVEAGLPGVFSTSLPNADKGTHQDGSALVPASFREMQEERGLNSLFVTPGLSSNYALVTLSCLV